MPPIRRECDDDALASVTERQRALAARFPRWEPMTIHAAFDRAAADFPDRPFLIADDRSWSYAEMAAWSRRLAAGLAARGVGPGDKVALILANYPEFVGVKLAMARLGAVAVPLNILNRRDELAYLLRQSDASLLVTMDRFRDNDYLVALDAIAPGWASGAQTAFPLLREVVVFATGEGDGRTGAIPFAALEGVGDAALPDVDPASDCDIVYTSGTSGPPKGVLLTHDMLTRTAFGSAWARAFEDGRCIAFALPMFHVFGYVEGLLAAPFVGGAIVPRLRFDAADFLAAVERHRASDALLIPAMTLALIDAAPAAARDLRCWHAALASGGRAPPWLWDGLRDVLGVGEITTGYGMSECTASTTVTRPDDQPSRLLDGNGRQRDVGIAGDAALGDRLVAYRVVDPETLAELPPDTLGELQARGPGVTRGYYRQPEATAAAFADGWLRTGDLGRIDPDGYVTLVGRLKESYRCGGEQVLPTEVEDLLGTHPDVAQAQVVPIPDERMGEVGVAFVVARAGAAIDPDALRSLVAQGLARYKVPRHVLVVEADAIPTTASGRARKFLLAELAARMLEKP